MRWARYCWWCAPIRRRVPRSWKPSRRSAMATRSASCSTSTRERPCSRAITKATKRPAPRPRAERTARLARGTWRQTRKIMTHQRLLMLMLLAASAAAPAADLDLTFHAGDTYTDNSLRIPDGPSDNIGAVALRLDLSAQGERYDAEVRTAVTYLHYFQGTQEN